MAALIDITCPDCKKALKAPEELKGKKIKCKGCGNVFTVAAAPAEKPPPKKVDDDDPNPYGIIKEDEGIARCPSCAGELESDDATICLHCGYNTVTRQKVRTRKVIETTPGEVFLWLLPGILSVVGILVLIGFDLFYCLAVPKLLKGGENEWIAAGAFRLWGVIISMFVMALLGKIAYLRLIVHPTPPDVERDI